MSKSKFIWLSINHLRWLNHVVDTPTLIDNPHLNQMAEKGLIEKGENGIWKATEFGAHHADLAARFCRQERQKKLSKDGLAQLSHTLQAELRHRDEVTDEPSLNNVASFARVG